MEKKNNVSSCIESYHILSQAEQFLKAAQYTRENGPFVIPSCVCAAFSIEVYFKFILLVEQNDLKTLKCHKLLDLFEEISQERKNIILNKVASAMQGENLTQTLDEFNEAFDMWRYEYEYDKITTTTRLHQIADIVGEVFRQINDKITCEKYGLTPKSEEVTTNDN